MGLFIGLALVALLVVSIRVLALLLLVLRKLDAALSAMKELADGMWEVADVIEKKDGCGYVSHLGDRER